jgi:PAS domain S-box-containing protein
MIAICTYSLGQCGASEVIDVVSNHQFALMRREGKWVIIESSDRKRAEEEYRAILHATIDGFWIADMSGRFLEVNDAYCWMIGYCRDELLTMRIRDVEAVERPEETARRIQKIMEVGGDRFETRHRCKDGRIIDIEISVNYMEVGGGRMFVFLRDITERKLAEEALHRTEENFRRSLDDSPLGVRVVTTKGETLYANRSMLNIYGYDSIEELRTTPVKERYTLESYAEFKIRRKKRRRGEYDPTEYEISIVRKNGEVRHLQVFRKEILWNGERQFQTLYQDITERKRAKAVLRESEERFRVLFESINDAEFVHYVDEEGSPRGFIQVNDVACQRLGYTREELLGLTPRDITTPEEYKRLFAKREKLISKGNIIVETVHVTRDGRQIPVESSVRIFDYLGKRAAISISRDITERKQAEEEMRNARTQLEQLNKHLIRVREDERALISRNIHDELGQSLTAIKIDLHWALENIGDKPALNQKLNNMLEIVSSTITTVQRIASELRPGILDDLGLASAIEWYCEEFEKRTGIQCRMDLEDIQSQDPQKTLTLFRILQESLTNVIRHAHAKNVTIKLSRLKEAFKLEIQDDGIGISQKKIDSKDSLGLIGIRERVRQLGGEFEIFKQKDKGTGLCISIPLNE